MISWLAKRRFNYADAWAFGLVGVALGKHSYVAAVICFVVGLIVSATIEAAAGPERDE